MSKLPSLRNGIGRWFWFGCLVGPIVFIIAFTKLGIIYDGHTFRFFSIIGIVVFGPIFGFIFQVIDDLFISRGWRLLRIWDYSIFLAIITAQCVAGYFLFKSPRGESPVDLFTDKKFDIAGAFAIFFVLIYLIRDRLNHFLSRGSSKTAVLGTKPNQIRVFIGGTFAIMFAGGLVRSVLEFISSFGTGTAPLLASAAGVIFKGLGIAVGLGVSMGNELAISCARILLLLIVIGGCTGLILSALKVWHPQPLANTAALIVYVCLLISQASQGF